MGEIQSTSRAVPGVLLAALFTAGASAQIQVEPRTIDFGERGQNERPEAVLTLRNLGSAPVSIRDLKKSCDCITLTPSRLPVPIPPGEAVEVRVSMGSGRAMGRLEKLITIVPGAPALLEESVWVTMRVLEDFDMEPRGVHLEGVRGSKPARAVAEVRLRSGRAASPVDLKLREIRGLFGRPSGQYLRATFTPVSRGQRIEIELDPQHPEGPISAELEASLNGKSLFLPITGEMFAWIKVAPNSLNFSRALESNPASTLKEVLLTSTDGTPFRVLEVQARPRRGGEKLVKLEFTVKPDGPGPGEASTVQKITCRALRGEGINTSFFGTVRVRTDHPHKPEITFGYLGFFDAPEAAVPPGSTPGERRAGKR